MENEINIEEVLKNMREVIGAYAQENAILKAQITKLTTDS
jgi:hypothetical protein